MSTDSRLFQPVKVGPYQLHNRVGLAPLTRFRASDEHVPLPMMAEYYAQRGSEPGTLLVTEATAISPAGAGMLNVPGLWTPEQIQGWKRVTDAVHRKGSYIFAQLWHLGRETLPEAAAKHGKDIVAPSAIPAGKDSSVPRELNEAEIHALIREYAAAARNAIFGAGFDGVEVHGANGYLIDQFLQDISNQRTDTWGGSVEGRSRFALEVTLAVVREVGAERVGLRLSPWGRAGGMGMVDPRPQFLHLLREMKKLGIAYLHFLQPRPDDSDDSDEEDEAEHPAADNRVFIEAWDNASPILLAGGYTGGNFAKTIDQDYPDRDVIVVYGRHFIANPDLVFRLRRGIPLNKYNRATFYCPKQEHGYIDYPFSSEYQSEHPQVGSSTE